MEKNLLPKGFGTGSKIRCEILALVLFVCKGKQYLPLLDMNSNLFTSETKMKVF